MSQTLSTKKKGKKKMFFYNSACGQQSRSRFEERGILFFSVFSERVCCICMHKHMTCSTFVWHLLRGAAMGSCKSVTRNNWTGNKRVSKKKKKFHYVFKCLDYGIPGTQRKTCKLLSMYVSLNIYKKLFNIIFIQLFCFMDRHFFFKL